MRRFLAVGLACALVPGAAQSQSPYRVLGSMSCNETYTGDITGKVFQSGMMINIAVPEWRRLADEAFRKQVLNSAFNENLTYCRSRKIEAVRAAVIVWEASHTILIAWLPSSDPVWRISVNRIDQQIQRQDAGEARKREEEAREKARREAIRKAEEARRLPMSLPDYDVDDHCRTSAKGTGLPNAAEIAIRCIGAQQIAYDKLKPLWPQAMPEVQHDCKALNDRPSWQRAMMRGAWPYESLLYCVAEKLSAAQSEKQLEGTKFKK